MNSSGKGPVFTFTGATSFISSFLWNLPLLCKYLSISIGTASRVFVMSQLWLCRCAVCNHIRVLDESLFKMGKDEFLREITNDHLRSSGSVHPDSVHLRAAKPKPSSLETMIQTLKDRLNDLNDSPEQRINSPESTVNTQQKLRMNDDDKNSNEMGVPISKLRFPTGGNKELNEDLTRSPDQKCSPEWT